MAWGRGGGAYHGWGGAGGLRRGDAAPYIHALIHTYIPTWMHEGVDTDMPYKQTNIRAYGRAYTHTYTPTYMHTS